MGEAADLVRRAFERFNAGDVDGLVELFDPEVEFQDVPVIPGSGVYTGRDGMRRWYEVVNEPLEDLSFEFGDCTEAGDAVAVLTTARGRGRGSGAEVEWRFSTTWRIRDGRIVHHRGHVDHADAVRKIGAGPG